MATILAGLSIQHRVRSTTKETGVTVNARTVSKQHLLAKMLVTPDSDPEGNRLGFLTVTVEAEDIPENQNMPELAPEQMKVWLVELLKRVM